MKNPIETIPVPQLFHCSTYHFSIFAVKDYADIFFCLQHNALQLQYETFIIPKKDSGSKDLTPSLSNSKRYQRHTF